MEREGQISHGNLYDHFKASFLFPSVILNDIE